MAFDFKDGGAVVDTSAGDDGIVMAAPSINSPRPAPYKWSALWAYIQSKAGTTLGYDVGTAEGDIPLLGPGGKLPHAQMNLASVPLTGIPTAPTATLGTNTTQLATTAFVQAAVAALIASAPGVLDTLDELAAALGDDANFAATITSALALKAPLASPPLTGTPTSPTATAGTNTTQIATTAFVQSLLNVAETTLASAATCDLASITTTRIEITGSTTITSFGSGTNRFRVLRFSGEVLLTYNVTSLILPGAADIRTAVGDVALVASDGSGNWRVVSYLRASGKAIAAPYVIRTAKDILRGDEGFAAEFLSRSALINDLTGAKSNAGKPEDLLTEVRATTATYVDRDRILKTAGVNVLRYQHDPLTGVPLGLLVEPAATNLLLRSQEFQTSWLRSGILAFGSGSVADAAIAPNGTNTMDMIVEDTANGSHYIYQNITVVAGSTNTLSFFVKPASGGRFVRAQMVSGSDGVRVHVDPSNGQITVAAVNLGTGSGASARVVPYPNGVYRIELTGVCGPSGTTVAAQIILQNVSNSAAGYTGDGVSGVYVWGAQLEAGSAATSYIPTTSAAATRNADAITIATSLLPGDASVMGTLFVDALTLGTTGATQSLAELNDATNNERVNINIGSTLIPAIFLPDGGVAQASAAVGSAVAVGQVVRMAMSYRVNDVAWSRDGGAVGTDTSATMPTVTRLQLGASASGGAVNGIIRRVAWFSRDLADSELVALTG